MWWPCTSGWASAAATSVPRSSASRTSWSICSSKGRRRGGPASSAGRGGRGGGGRTRARPSLSRQLYTHVFPGHPYGRPVLGDEAALKAATRETIRGYYRRHYAPENMVLVVIGAGNPADVSAVVERTFARVPAAGYRRQPLPPPPPLPGVRRHVVSRNEKQAHPALRRGAPPPAHPGGFAADLRAPP